MNQPVSPVAAEGTCAIFFAFDVSQSIDLAEAERILAEAAHRESIRRGPARGAPTEFEFRPRPLVVRRAAAPVRLADRETSGHVDLTMFDFGAVSVSFTAPASGALSSLVPVSEALAGNAALLDEARRQVQALAAIIAPALRAPMLSEVVEDYAVYRVRLEAEASGAAGSSPARHGVPGHQEAEALVRSHAPLIAAILRCDGSPLSAGQIEDSVSCRVSYAPGDVAVIDWNAAIVIADDAPDVLTVLEYANVELMEMRFLDDRLDRDVDLAYDAVNRPVSALSRVRGSRGALLRRIARLQMDSAMLFEEVNNALKLLGDQYLARVYSLASQRFHLAEWDASITRKLETLDSIYQKLAEERATLRMEVLEWIIILLIAFEVVMSFVR